MEFTEVMEGFTRGFEILGLAVFVAGTAWAFILMVIHGVQGRTVEGYRQLRRSLGRVIVLGLEILIIADVIQTITVDLTWEGVLGLALIVFVRTFLSFALEIELDGVVPWKRAEFERRYGRSVDAGGRYGVSGRDKGNSSGEESDRKDDSGGDRS
jgi:uncharacterized membrane protein